MDFSRVRAVFTDLDGTLTTNGNITSSTYAALESLDRAHIPVVLVTGRPAGWVHALVHTWPLSAAVSENGGVFFVWQRTSSRRILRKYYSVAQNRLPNIRRQMFADAHQVCRTVRGARLAKDTAYTEVNLAVSWNEDTRLSLAQARHIEELLRTRGYHVARSSIQINFWPGKFDKFSAARRVIKSLFGDVSDNLDAYVYVGDSLNDESMFRGFPRSIGVANIRTVWDELTHRPAFVTTAAGGKGFEEVTDRILASLTT